MLIAPPTAPSKRTDAVHYVPRMKLIPLRMQGLYTGQYFPGLSRADSTILVPIQPGETVTYFSNARQAERAVQRTQYFLSERRLRGWPMRVVRR
jgi:hypothetical protein